MLHKPEHADNSEHSLVFALQIYIFFFTNEYFHLFFYAAMPYFMVGSSIPMFWLLSLSREYLI